MIDKRLELLKMIVNSDDEGINKIYRKIKSNDSNNSNNKTITKKQIIEAMAESANELCEDDILEVIKIGMITSHAMTKL